jgi:hypothetical protein
MCIWPDRGHFIAIFTTHRFFTVLVTRSILSGRGQKVFPCDLIVFWFLLTCLYCHRQLSGKQQEGHPARQDM